MFVVAVCNQSTTAAADRRQSSSQSEFDSSILYGNGYVLMLQKQNSFK